MSKRAMLALEPEIKDRFDTLSDGRTQNAFQERLLDLWEATNPIERETKIAELKNRKESE